MLRLAAGLLILANLLFLGWVQGWMSPVWPPPRQGEREPERLAAQVRPGAVTVLPPRAASAALSAARAAAMVCLEAGPLGEAEAAAAESGLAAAKVPDGRWTREAVPITPSWLVYGGHYPEAATRRAREQELRKLGIGFEMLTTAEAPAELAPGFVLSRHPDREAAEAALAAQTALSGARLRGVRVLSLPPPPATYWLRLAQVEPELVDGVKALPAGFKACATR